VIGQLGEIKESAANTTAKMNDVSADIATSGVKWRQPSRAAADGE